MIFLFVAPFALGLANFLLPLQIGAPDMAFPAAQRDVVLDVLVRRTDRFSPAPPTNEGAAAAGWTAYAPLSEIKISTGLGQDLVDRRRRSSFRLRRSLTAINFITTVFIYRAPGMTMWRIPIFAWEMVATSLLIFMAFPALAADSAACSSSTVTWAATRSIPAFGGSPILWQHLFWFFGHPEVYVMILPYFGVISEIIPVFSRKPIFGYTGLGAGGVRDRRACRWASGRTTCSPRARSTTRSSASCRFLIAVPTGVKFFNWIAHAVARLDHVRRRRCCSRSVF